MEDNQSLAIVEGGRGQVAEARQRPPAPGPAKVGGEMVPTPSPTNKGCFTPPTLISESETGFLQTGVD